MKSFASVVHSYLRMRGGVASDPVVRDVARKASSDLMRVLWSHDWRFMTKEMTVRLWGTKNLTVRSLTGKVLYVNETVGDELVNQIVTIPGSSRYTPYVITETAPSNGLVLDADFQGTTPSSGDKAVVYQVSVDMPTDYFMLQHPVVVNGRPVSIVDHRVVRWSSEQLTVGGLPQVAVVPGRVLLTAPVVGHIRLRYREIPTLVYYDDGVASVGDEKNRIVGDGTKWKSVESSAGGSLLRIEESETFEMFPYGEDVLTVDSDTGLTLKSKWQGSSKFSYVLSTKLDWPPYMWTVVDALARAYAGKVEPRDMTQILLDAKVADAGQPVGPEPDYGLGVRVEESGPIRVYPDFG